MNNNKTAIVIGATGLVGKQLVSQLLSHSKFSKVVLLVRRSTGITHSKMEEMIIQFDELENHKTQIKGDVLFSCMGTTIKKAKTKENQFKIDYTYQYQTAQLAAGNGVKTYVLVSSAGANAKSNTFYSRIKGELEEAVTSLPFEKIRILRPSILMGNRTEFRLGEKIGIGLMSVLQYIPFLKKWRGIKDTEVAQAMISLALDTNSDKVVVKQLDELFELN
tara:strand:- start:50983 stop:51642 length:660 start_codon:yes stop_codon:yes gene_type:complete